MLRWQKEIGAVVSSCQSLLKLLQEGLERFAATLGREYEAICEHNIRKLESIAIEKSKRGDQLQSLFASLGQEAASLTLLYGQVTGEAQVVDPSLSALARMVAKIMGDSSWQGHPQRAAAERQREELLALVKACQEKFWGIKTEVEKNRFVMSQLLYNHQQSYCFWQTTVKEASSSYDRSGVRRTPESISQFHTKV